MSLFQKIRPLGEFSRGNDSSIRREAAKRCWSHWIVLLLLSVVEFAFSLPAEAAFEISMAPDGGTLVDVGQFRTITISYSWASLTQDLENAVVTVDLPATLDTDSQSDVTLLGSAHVASSNYNPTTRQITFTFMNPLPAGSSGNLQFAVRFPTTAADGTLAAINATSTALGQPNDLSSATLEANVPPGVTNLDIWKSPNLSPMLGQDVTYTIAVDNWGTTSFLTPVVVDQLPAGTTYVSSSPNGTYNAGNQTVTWTNSTLQPGNSHYYYVTVRYAAPTFAEGQWVDNAASATGTDSLSAPVNIDTVASVQIIAPSPSAEIDKWDSVEPASLGGSLTYFFRVRNQGNVDLTNFTFTDDLPKEFIPENIYIGSDGSGYNHSSEIRVWIKTTSNSVWQELPGSPFTTTAYSDPYVSVGSLGLPVGTVVSSIKYQFASVPVHYDAQWRPRIQGTIGIPSTGLDRDGAAISGLPKTIQNTYSVTFDHGTSTYNGSDTETTGIMAAAPLPTFTLGSPTPATTIPLQEMTWTMRMENATGGAVPLINPVYGALLPPSLEYVTGSVSIVEGTLPSPTVTVTPNYNGTGRQLVRFAFAGNQPVAWTEISGNWDDWAVLMNFKTRVKAGTAVGAGSLDYHLIGHGNAVLNTSLLQAYPVDVNDLDGDSNTTENLPASNSVGFNVSSSTAIDSVLWVG